MSEKQLLNEVESLKNIVKRYAKVMKEQEKTILDLRARLLELCVNWQPSEISYDREGMLDKLEQAQLLLSDVYHEACDAGLTEVESQMSCADSCIGEAISALDANQENLFFDWFGVAINRYSTPHYTSYWYYGWCYWCII